MQIKNNIFHIHTRRCRHASQDEDREYVESAISHGAKVITFTDHTPFPENPLDRRMLYEELEEYVSSLKSLRNEFEGQIKIEIGLEIEYMPKFHDFFRSLYESGDYDLLMLGQHFAQDDVIFGERSGMPMHEDSDYPVSERVKDAILAGIDTGWFKGIAHPDRTFRTDGDWNEKMSEIARPIIDSAVSNGMFLEINMASKLKQNFFRPQFWELVPKEAIVVVGLDAHSVIDLNYRYMKMEEILGDIDIPLTTWHSTLGENRL